MMDLSKNISWESFIRYIRRNSNLYYSKANYNKGHKGLKRDDKLPYSISENEFNYFKSFIIKHNLKSGYELGTGNAIATVSIAYGLKCNGGYLVSVDNYSEYATQTMPMGSVRFKFSISAYEKNIRLLDLFKLSNINLVVGNSPKDSKKILRKNLDFVFLDCPKNNEDYIRDVSFLPAYLSDKFAIFVHDTHCFHDEFIESTKDIFNIDPVFIYEFDNDTQVFPLALITNIKI